MEGKFEEMFGFIESVIVLFLFTRTKLNLSGLIY